MATSTVESYAPGPALIDAKGNRSELTADAYAVIRDVLRVIDGDRPANDNNDNGRLLSTGQAAEILGVSRRTVDRIIDAGEIPATRNSQSGHRRVRLNDVIAYHERSSASRREALAQMRDVADKGGLYDLDMADYMATFDGR